MSDEWVAVVTVGTEGEAALIAGYLESEGLAAVIESRRFNQEPVNFGNMARVEVKVPVAEAERAVTLLRQADERLPDDSPCNHASTLRRNHD